ncbi:MAG: co-chaperone GroES [Pseudomonadota bacterium]
MTSQSGLAPMEYNVVIRPDALETTTPGGIILNLKERDEWAIHEGVIDAVSVHAFGYAEWPEGARKPAVGDRVMFAKHAGALIERGGVKYRVVKDKDIIAVLDEPPALAVAA